MATKFLEPGGDATFNVATITNGGLWPSIVGTPVLATDFVHGSHVKSIKYDTTAQNHVKIAIGTVSDTGGRISFYVYFASFDSFNPDKSSIAGLLRLGANARVMIKVTDLGVIQLWNQSTSQIGTDGATLATGRWYRISLAYTITSTTVNRFELFVDAVSSISVTNATLSAVLVDTVFFGNFDNDDADFRTSDHYVDDSTSLTDTGDIWVTAKRPNANGTTNGFTTQIGVGGSGYGSGHSPQVNERPLSTTNGWSMIGAGSAITEEYNIEGQNTGDIDLRGMTIVDFVGWVYASALVSETAQIVVAGSSSNISLTSTNTMFTKVAGSASYPGGGTDIGIITSTTVTTVSLYECGIIVAATPLPPVSVDLSSAMTPGLKIVG